MNDPIKGLGTQPYLLALLMPLGGDYRQNEGNHAKDVRKNLLEQPNPNLPGGLGGKPQGKFKLPLILL